MTDFASLACEIFDGCSPIKFGDESLFLRHKNLQDQRDLAMAFERQKQRAIKNHVPTEKEKLELLQKQGSWQEKDELEIEAKESYISTLKQTKSQLQIKSQKTAIQEDIDKEYKGLNNMLSRRRELVGKTAEDFAHSRANEEFVRKLIYRDEHCKILRFSEEEFNQLEQSELSELVSEYHAINTRISDNSTQELVLSDAFSLYLGQTDKPYDFYARPIISLSIYQLEVLAYGRMFLNIFQNVDEIPDRVKKSPKDLLDFVESKQKRDKREKTGKNHSAMALVGATKEDLEDYDPSAKKLDLAAAIKKKGGKLSTEDFDKLLNQ